VRENRLDLSKRRDAIHLSQFTGAHIEKFAVEEFFQRIGPFVRNG
jgi:hypothetical protein